MNVFLMGTGTNAVPPAGFVGCRPVYRQRGVAAYSVSTDSATCAAASLTAPCIIYPTNPQAWASNALSAVLGLTPTLNWGGGGFDGYYYMDWIDPVSSSSSNCIYNGSSCFGYVGPQYMPSLAPAASAVEFGAPWTDEDGDFTNENNNSGILHAEGLLVPLSTLTYGVVQFSTVSVQYNSETGSTTGTGDCNNMQISVLQTCQDTAPSAGPCIGCGFTALGGTLIMMPLPGSITGFYPACKNADGNKPTAAVYTAAFQINPATNYTLTSCQWGTVAYASIDDFITNTEFGLQAFTDIPISWTAGTTPPTCPMEDTPP